MRLSDIEPRFVCAPPAADAGRGSAGLQLEQVDRPGHGLPKHGLASYLAGMRETLLSPVPKMLLRADEVITGSEE
jgi:hypothetical protein